jgi:two-component system chemotaxis response regulator CheY
MSKTILLVDDSLTTRRQAGKALAEAGFDVVEAANGLEGVGQIQRLDDVALIITDINMPDMDGFEMIEHIKAGPKGAAVPFLMLTSDHGARQVERAQALGAVGWVIKPFKPASLVATVKKITAGP